MIGVAPEAKILNIKVLRAVAVAPGVITPPAADTPFNRCLFRGGSGFFSWTLEGTLTPVDETQGFLLSFASPPLRSSYFQTSRNHGTACRNASLKR